MEHKIAVVGMSANIHQLVKEIGKEVIVIENDKQIKEYSNMETSTFKITAPPLPYLEQEYVHVPKNKKSVHHNSKWKPAKRKKPGKKTHRKK
jgi:hypothetical protein